MELCAIVERVDVLEANVGMQGQRLNLHESKITKLEADIARAATREQKNEVHCGVLQCLVLGASCS